MHRAAGLRLAILAMALQTALLANGGTVCFDAVPLPWLQVDCPDPCCDSDGACCPGDVAPLGTGSSWPAPTDCCIRGSVDYALRGDGPCESADPVPAAVPSPSLPVALVPARGSLSSAAPSEIRRPPPIQLVGVVVLQV